MKALNPNKVLVSAFQNGKTDEQNRANHERAYDILRREGLNFRVVRGVYKGVAELSFVLFGDDIRTHEGNLQACINLARLFNQESVLEVHNDGAAALHYLNSGYRVERIGTFKGVSEAEAAGREAFTYDPLSGQYFVVE